MKHMLSVSIEVRKAGMIYQIEPWRRPPMGRSVILSAGDAVGVVVQMRMGEKHLRFAAGYAEDDE